MLVNVVCLGNVILPVLAVCNFTIFYLLNIIYIASYHGNNVLKPFLFHPLNPKHAYWPNMADLRQKNIAIVGISFAATILDAILNF